MTPSSIALSASGCGKSSFGFALAVDAAEVLETESSEVLTGANCGAKNSGDLEV